MFLVIQKKKSILYFANFKCVGDDPNNSPEPEKSEKIKSELKNDSSKPFKTFKTATAFKAHNRRISKKYQQKSEAWMYKFGIHL